MKQSRSARAPRPTEGTPALGSLSEFLLRKAREAAPRKAHPYPPPFDQLEPHVAEIVTARWGQLCEELFDYLAVEHPDQLVRLLLSMKMPASDLTFAAEIAGRIDDSRKVRPVLLALLKHPDPVVREGAIYGLARHVDPSVIAELQRLVTTDLSPAVRTAASDLLAANP